MDERGERPNDRELAERVLEKFRTDGKIRAVKLYMELTGAGLAEAKEAVEELERRASSASEARGDSGGRGESADEAEIERETMQRLKSTGKIQAVKYFMERTGMSLRDSKSAVERLAALHGLPADDPRGCAGVLLFVLLPAFALLLLRWSD
ncbi:MAG TPA: hypothetical protein DCQ98_19115 [Planctomycetaceae bacterium]|nr:hypothetical protein [Planctomycetaceae bacterium]HRE99772.1 hypothetical protein [Pirellulaceae bacterium]